jgi:predicted nucleotide-binding protein
MAYPAGANPKTARPRPRQNVVGELFYFVGKLGRNRVFVLKRGDDLELPSDFAGVVYTPYDAGGSWRLDLVRELRAAGYTVDANSLISA